MLAIRGPFGYPAALLAATATLVYAVLAAMLIRTGAVVLSALSTVAAFAMVATGVGLALQARPGHVAILAGPPGWAPSPCCHGSRCGWPGCRCR